MRSDRLSWHKLVIDIQPIEASLTPLLYEEIVEVTDIPNYVSNLQLLWRKNMNSVPQPTEHVVQEIA
jgi:hypothetical protein